MRLIGRESWTPAGRDENGWRTYKVTHLVQGNRGEGPALAMQCPGLPLPGDQWLIDSDLDVWVWCRADMDVKEVKTKEPAQQFTVSQTFSNKPPEKGKAPQARLCQDQQIEDPLMEPQKIGGSYVTNKIQADYDRFGDPIINSAWQKITGPNNEWDDDRPQITIEQNVVDLQAALLYRMRDTVNDRPLWGCPTRSIKFKPGHFERKPYGRCNLYYTRTLEFEVNIRVSETITAEWPDGVPVSGWDKDFNDEGTAVLMGNWVFGTGPLGRVPVAWKPVAGADPENPTHFMRYKDPYENPTSVLLDGHGVPWIPRPKLITDCDACPGGAPKTWNLTGYQDASTDLTVAEEPVTNFADVKMAQTSGCAWSGIGVGFTATLAYPAGVWTLTLAGSSVAFTTPWVYTLAGPSFACLGGNAMNKASGPAGIPDTVTISPSGTNKPGRKHVEYYDESNFLLLGIPLFF